jgi:hypothetical protein
MTAAINRPIIFSRNLRLLLDVCLFLIFLTASFDVFLNLKISGFSIRICNLFMVFFSAVVFITATFSGKQLNLKLIGFWSFLVWFIFLSFFVQNSILIQRGVGYHLWLVIFFAFILAMSLYVKSFEHFERILILYLRSFTLIAVLALFQFVFALFGLNAMVSYFFQSGIPRIHGLSYEPSYFSTYLIVPWTFHFLLYFSKNEILKKKTKNNISLLILTTVILLSFSRMGILLAGLIVGYKSLTVILKSIVLKKIRISELTFITIVSFAVAGILTIAVIYSKKFISIFEGLPFFSKYAHSASIRLDDFMNTWHVFEQSPWAGYSLGGIAPAIAQMKGYGSLTQDVVKNTEGMCVLVEVLAASGIIGFLFFTLFLGKVLLSSKQLTRLNNQTHNSRISLYLNGHRLLIAALIAQLILLCMNQNILRNYLWIHIAIVNLSFFSLKDAFKMNEQKQNA